MSVIILSVAELGAMKAVVDQILVSKNKGEQTKHARLIVSYLNQINRMRGSKAMTNIELTYISMEYSLEEDDVTYAFTLRDKEPSPDAAALEVMGLKVQKVADSDL